MQLCFSQDSLKTISVPLRYIRAANSAYIELKSYKRQASLYQNEIDFKNTSILFYEKTIRDCNTKDSLNAAMILNREQTANEYENLYTAYKKAYRRERVRSILMYVLLPTAIGATAVATYYITK